MKTIVIKISSDLYEKIKSYRVEAPTQLLEAVRHGTIIRDDWERYQAIMNLEHAGLTKEQIAYVEKVFTTDVKRRTYDVIADGYLEDTPSGAILLNIKQALKG